ncbi:hypothetical protein BOTCAL_0091g00350 [Botryotinia calthae]|uniref:Uncharacterized protein n=1 Tax=Botryotinia calthae TaxID=38488 RepID=A0A4Y8D7F9_9HELO|nr:hypothetical protein BOTCAL_0091g00350 [Botryotinia calthae]
MKAWKHSVLPSLPPKPSPQTTNPIKLNPSNPQIHFTPPSPVPSQPPPPSPRTRGKQGTTHSASPMP